AYVCFMVASLYFDYRSSERARKYPFFNSVWGSVGATVYLDGAEGETFEESLDRCLSEIEDDDHLVDRGCVYVEEGEDARVNYYVMIDGVLCEYIWDNMASGTFIVRNMPSDKGRVI